MNKKSMKILKKIDNKTVKYPIVSTCDISCTAWRGRRRSRGGCEAGVPFTYVGTLGATTRENHQKSPKNPLSKPGKEGNTPKPRKMTPNQEKNQKFPKTTKNHQK
jgi:hypothetical protein